VNIVDNGALFVHQVSRKILIGSMFVVIAAMIAANSYYAIIKGREVKRGYTTMPLNYQFLKCL
jgi:hypothetical protein